MSFLSPRLHPPPAHVPGIPVSPLTSRMPLHVFVIHSVGFLITFPLVFFLFPKIGCSLAPSGSLSLSLSLRFECVTCSFCLYPFPFSFVVTLLYKRISKGNILSRVTLYCTLDTGELRIYSGLGSFSSSRSPTHHREDNWLIG